MKTNVSASRARKDKSRSDSGPEPVIAYSVRKAPDKKFLWFKIDMGWDIVYEDTVLMNVDDFETARNLRSALNGAFNMGRLSQYFEERYGGHHG